MTHSEALKNWKMMLLKIYLAVWIYLKHHMLQRKFGGVAITF